MTTQPEVHTVEYTLDAAASAFTVQAFAAGLLSTFGHNPKIAIRSFTGEARFVQETLADASLHIRIDAASLEVVDDVKEKDRNEIERMMHDEVLETARYAEIVFRSTSVTPTRITPTRFKARIVGEITLHGVTRGGVWLLAQLSMDGDRLVAKGDFTLKQTDYGIKLVSAVGGALKVKDELKFEFELVGSRTSREN